MPIFGGVTKFEYAFKQQWSYVIRSVGDTCHANHVVISLYMLNVTVGWIQAFALKQSHFATEHFAFPLKEDEYANVGDLPLAKMREPPKVMSIQSDSPI